MLRSMKRCTDTISVCVLWWKNRAVGSDTVKMTEQSDVLDSHRAAGSVELQRDRGSGGKLLRLHSGSVTWVLHTLCNFSFVTERDLWKPISAIKEKKIKNLKLISIYFFNVLTFYLML